MSTKSKNPLFKRVKIEITQEIIDNSEPNNPQNCYFYNAIRSLLNIELGACGSNLGVLVRQYRIYYMYYSLPKSAAKFINDGCLGKKVSPASFNVWIPREYLK